MTKQIQKEKRYIGYFLLDSGVKINFDISEEDGGEEFSIELYGNGNFPFEKGGYIWLGENNSMFLLVDRIVGWKIDEYEV